MTDLEALQARRAQLLADLSDTSSSPTRHELLTVDREIALAWRTKQQTTTTRYLHRGDRGPDRPPTGAALLLRAPGEGMAGTHPEKHGGS